MTNKYLYLWPVSERLRPVSVAGVGAEDNGDHHDHTEDQEDTKPEDSRQ